MIRIDARAPEKLRELKIVKDYIKYAEGSCLIECGDTKVICTATLEENVPSFLKNTGTGWVTAEYGMLPRSCETRIKRDRNSGREMEIQRLVGRSLRSVIDMNKLGERTVKIDCDVIQGDGGTRTASINGGFVALALALMKLRKKGVISALPLTDYVAAISVGILGDTPLLDLNYAEDSKAELDMNIVMVGRGKFVEIQGTAEGKPFSRNQMDKLLDLAKKGIEEVIEIQKGILEGLQL